MSGVERHIADLKKNGTGSMKTSQLIAKLAGFIATDGDQEVKFVISVPNEGYISSGDGDGEYHTPRIGSASDILWFDITVPQEDDLKIGDYYVKLVEVTDTCEED
jgi:hypothetical protein